MYFFIRENGEAGSDYAEGIRTCSETKAECGLDGLNDPLGGFLLMGLRTARNREPNRGRTEPHEPLNRFQPVYANLTEPNGTARTLDKADKAFRVPCQRTCVWPAWARHHSPISQKEPAERYQQLFINAGIRWARNQLCSGLAF